MPVIEVGRTLAEEIADARDRFYPGHWTYQNLEGLPKDLRPFYRVGVSSVEDYQLAKLALPKGVTAEIIHPGGFTRLPYQY